MSDSARDALQNAAEPQSYHRVIPAILLALRVNIGVLWEIGDTSIPR